MNTACDVFTLRSNSSAKCSVRSCLPILEQNFVHQLRIRFLLKLTRNFSIFDSDATRQTSAKEKVAISNNRNLKVTGSWYSWTHKSHVDKVHCVTCDLRWHLKLVSFGSSSIGHDFIRKPVYILWFCRSNISTQGRSNSRQNNPNQKKRNWVRSLVQTKVIIPKGFIGNRLLKKQAFVTIKHLPNEQKVATLFNCWPYYLSHTATKAHVICNMSRSLIAKSAPHSRRCCCSTTTVWSVNMIQCLSGLRFDVVALQLETI